MSKTFDKIVQTLDAAEAKSQHPVPPAGGEVEVLAKVAGHNQLHWNGPMWTQTPMGTELVDRAHVTRLTAENARLQDDKETMRRKNNELNDTVTDLQSDLTKARELLGRVYDADLAARHHQPYNVSKVFDDIESFLAHQSAPAAKEGE